MERFTKEPIELFKERFLSFSDIVTLEDMLS